MRRRLGKAAVLGAVLAVVAAVSASALHLQAGNLVVDGDGGFAPTNLAKDRFTPIRAFFHGTIGTLDGTRPSPLKTLVLEIDRNSLTETRGLPKCSLGKLKATTTPHARRACPGAIVGTGFGTVLTELPEQAPIRTSSALTIFNGPEVHGNPTAIGHAHLDYPIPTTYLAQAEIEKVDNGRYGYRIEVDFPKIVNWYGSPISGRFEINRKWHYQGRLLSYANARCVDGRLQARVELDFKDETRLRGAAFKPCTVKR